MPPARPDDREQTREAVAARYASLARAAQAGQPVNDCDPAEFAAGRFGPAGYPDTGGLPEGAVRVSLGCGNPVVVADLRPGRRCWTWAAAAASTCCCPRAGSARPGRPTAWT